jgi:trehalose 6-phosphate phosphatase
MHGAGRSAVSGRVTQIGGLPHAIEDSDQLEQRLGGRRPAVFLDYDGTLTPIVDRPEDALISDSMRAAVKELAGRCTVCVVSGRDRLVVQELMGIDDLVVAGSHGFDIWSPDAGSIERQEGVAHEGLLAEVTRWLHDELDAIPGALVETKRSSVAAHYRLVAEESRPRVADVVDAILAAHPQDLKVTPGKMVFEIQPRVDWDKGKAVLYLLDALKCDPASEMALYLGDDVTDEHAFAALAGGKGIGIFVGSADDPEVGGRETAADFRLNAVPEVEQFLRALAR